MPQQPVPNSLFVTKVKSANSSLKVTPSGGTGIVTIEASGLGQQSDPSAQTVSATLTAADLLTQIITANQGAAAAASYQLPLAADLAAAVPAMAIGDSFDFSLINISANAAETATLTTNDGWTLVGSMATQANSAATTKSSGRFRARKTAAATFTLYRIA